DWPRWRRGVPRRRGAGVGLRRQSRTRPALGGGPVRRTDHRPGPAVAPREGAPSAAPDRETAVAGGPVRRHGRRGRAGHRPSPRAAATAAGAATCEQRGPTMKFLAILKDSLLESLDSTVLYVMLGLSLLLALIAASFTFTPEPGGKNIMRHATEPLTYDMRGIKAALKEGGGPASLELRRRGVYDMERAEPLDGQPDEWGSTFEVVVVDNNPLGFMTDRKKEM